LPRAFAMLLPRAFAVLCHVFSRPFATAVLEQFYPRPLYLDF
jgi:hypothetical protein